MTGIYKITNTINGKVYVGLSVDIETRLAAHYNEYEHIRYSNKPLYQAMAKYGEENFKNEIIEECNVDQLDEREAFWIKELQSLIYLNGYNITTGGNGVANENHPRHKLTTQDIIDIRTRYNNRERCKEVEKLYLDRIGTSGFRKIWKGETWKNIMPEVYTSENKEFHRHNTGQVGSANGRALLNELQVYEIRVRKKNGEQWREVYKDYEYTGIQPACFYLTWTYLNWKHIQVD